MYIYYMCIKKNTVNMHLLQKKKKLKTHDLFEYELLTFTSFCQVQHS